MLPMEEITVRVRAVAAGLGEADNDKHTRFAWITGSVVDHDQHTGEQITAFLYFSDKTTTRSLESLLHFGFVGDDLEQLADADEDKCSQILPGIAEFVCAPELYNGEWQLKVKWVNRAGRGKFAPKKKLEGGELKAFAAQMKGALKNARGAARTPRSSAPVQNPTHPNAPGNDDDLPF